MHHNAGLLARRILTGYTSQRGYFEVQPERRSADNQARTFVSRGFAGVVLDVSRNDFLMDQLGGLNQRLRSHCLHQCRNLDRREIGKSVGDGVRQNNPAVVAQGSTSIDHIRDVTFPFGRFGPNQGLPRPGQNLGWIVFVQQNGTDGIFADGPDAVGK